MPRNGSGVYSLPQAPFVSGTVISSAAVNSDFSDIATALTGSLPINGSTGMTGQLKIADGSTVNPSLTYTNEANTGLNRPSTGQLGIVVQGTQVGFFDSGGWEGATTAGVPVGAVMDFAGSIAPARWVLCYGQAISRTTYATLFGIIGTTYGTGDGSTTFNLPDYRGRVLFGQDNMGGSAANRITVAGGNYDGTVLGNSGGLQNHTLLASELAAHTHPNSLTDPGHSHSTNANIDNAATNTTGGGVSIPGTGAATVFGNTTGISVSVLANTGGGNAHTILNPSIITNKIIYAGV